jgi:multimeric flavodoxin WrbA
MMKKVLLVNGSSHEEGCTYTALKEIQDSLADAGFESDLLWLKKDTMPDCIACGYCSKHEGCVYKDVVDDVGRKLDDYAGIVIGSPVYYSGPTARLQGFMDRLCYAWGDKLDGMFGASVVSCRRGGNSASFERLNQYFLINNMYVVGSSYWNMIHGFTAGDAKKDAEGLQTMRNLALNIGYFMRMINAAESVGVLKPKREEQIMTNFMDGKEDEEESTEEQ